MKKVFISYSHDNDEHSNRVRELTEKLRKDKIEMIIDTDNGLGGPPEGWPMWSEAQIKNADQVLVACTETYYRRYEGEEEPRKGLGSACEARAIRQLVYNEGGSNEKFRVILFTENDEQNIPLNLQPYHHFPLHKPDVYEQLLKWLQPAENTKDKNTLTEEIQVQWPELNESYEWQIADRKKIHLHFTNIITGKHKQRILLLSGNSSKGKTVLLNELSKFAKKQKIATAFLDFKGCPTLDDLFETLLLDVDGSLLPQTAEAGDTKRQHKFISDLKQLQSPLLLVFDTYEKASEESKRWLESQLLQRMKQLPAVIVIIAGQNIPEHEKFTWSELVKEYDLPPIDKVQDWLEFTHNKWGCTQITKQQVETLTKATEGNPAQLFSLLEVFVKNLQTSEGR